MGKYKITVYAISKNEEKFVDRWMDSVSTADEVVVLDTGSTDNTVEKLKARGVKVVTEIISPWRFDIARNKSMDLISENTDICVMNDLDEVFEEGWRDKLEEKWSKTYTRAQYTFVWSHNNDNSINKKYTMEKIHIRYGFRWVNPVHEVLKYTGTIPDNSLIIPELILHHYPDLNKPRSQYLPLLELSVLENPLDDRATFWLGREYIFYGMYDECINTLKTHLTLPTANWPIERSASMRFIALAYDKQGDKSLSKIWLYKAIGECPYVREPYMALAKIAYRDNEWILAHTMIQQALDVTIANDNYLVETENWGGFIHDIGSICCYNLGLYDAAKNHILKALQFDPIDERLLGNLELIEEKITVIE